MSLWYKRVERPVMIRIMNTSYMTPETAKLVREIAEAEMPLAPLAKAQPDGNLGIVIEDWPAHYVWIPRFPRLHRAWMRGAERVRRVLGAFYLESEDDDY